MPTSTTRIPATLYGPWGCQYKITRQTVAVNAALFIARHSNSSTTTDTIPYIDATDARLLYQAAAYPTLNRAMLKPLPRLSIEQFWVRVAEPLEDEWELVAYYYNQNAEFWNSGCQHGVSLHDRDDGQL